MAEIFSISGAGYSNGYNGHSGRSSFGQPKPAPCPQGWQVTPNGNCGAPMASCPSSARAAGACRSPQALKLQTAVAALGRAVNDSALASLGADGFIGPATAAAVNRAFTAHIGAGQATARFRTGAMTVAQVANEAELITGVIGAEVLRRGARLPAPVVTSTPAAPGAKPLPTAFVPAMPGEGSPVALWGLIGLSAVAASVGLYLTYTRA